MARIAALSPEATPELKETFEQYRRSMGFVPNSVLIMQRRPKLVRALAQLAAAVWDPDSTVQLGFKRLTMATPLEAEPVEVGERFLAAHGWTPAKHLGR